LALSRSNRRCGRPPGRLDRPRDAPNGFSADAAGCLRPA